MIAYILRYAPGITTEPLEVLSMYDGMSCGRLALDKLGAHIVRYCATEIDKYAVKTTQANFPDTRPAGGCFPGQRGCWKIGAEDRAEGLAEKRDRGPWEEHIRIAGLEIPGDGTASLRQFQGHGTRNRAQAVTKAGRAGGDRERG